VNQLVIPRHIFDDMIVFCREGYPCEACGILAGKGCEVSRLYRMRNVENSPVSYLMDSTDQFRVLKELRKNGLSIVALFHSHPSSAAFPSAKDVELAFYEDSAYVIVSLSGRKPSASAFFIRNGTIEEVEIRISRSLCS
jgi:proteasome lid subunit RPN8/RPN11